MLGYTLTESDCVMRQQAPRIGEIRVAYPLEEDVVPGLQELSCVDPEPEQAIIRGCQSIERPVMANPWPEPSDATPGDACLSLDISRRGVGKTHSAAKRGTSDQSSGWAERGNLTSRASFGVYTRYEGGE